MEARRQLVFLLRHQARLAKLLNKNGKIFIREPIKESHGMPASDILTLFTNSGLKEIRSDSGKTEYKGIFKYEV